MAWISDGKYRWFLKPLAALHVTQYAVPYEIYSSSEPLLIISLVDMVFVTGNFFAIQTSVKIHVVNCALFSYAVVFLPFNLYNLLLGRRN